jgi:hypothetical protein
MYTNNRCDFLHGNYLEDEAMMKKNQRRMMIGASFDYSARLITPAIMRWGSLLMDPTLRTRYIRVFASRASAVSTASFSSTTFAWRPDELSWMAQLFLLRPPHELSWMAQLFRLRPPHGLSLAAQLFPLRLQN